MNKTQLLLVLYNHAKYPTASPHYVSAAAVFSESASLEKSHPKGNSVCSSLAIQLSKCGCGLIYKQSLVFEDVDCGSGSRLLNVDLASNNLDLFHYAGENYIAAGSDKYLELMRDLENIGVKTGISKDDIEKQDEGLALFASAHFKSQ